MYLSSSREGSQPRDADAPPDASPDAPLGAPPGTASGSGRTRRLLRTAVAANVVALGLVSLVTDISSEMVTAVLPVYLVTGLGLSMLEFGVLDGLYSGATTAVRLVGGVVADRFAARKAVAAVGYGVSAVAKLGFPLVGASVTGIGIMVSSDRAGKGLRTAPRDALISLSSSPATQGRAFGLHRALDTVGAFLGPLLAFTMLATAGTAYDAVFVTSFCVAALGVVMLLLFVRDHRGAAAPRTDVSLRAGLRLLADARFRSLCASAVVLGLATVSDAFVYLVLRSRLDITTYWFPLLPLGTAGVYLLLAVPLGHLADRAGRSRVFLAGHAALLGAYVLLAGNALHGQALLITVLSLHGTFYAATDGVLMAAASGCVPLALRTSGLAVLQTGQAGARFASSLLFGAAWTRWGPRTSLWWFAAALGTALVLSVPVLRGTRKEKERDA